MVCGRGSVSLARIEPETRHANFNADSSKGSKTIHPRVAFLDIACPGLTYQAQYRQSSNMALLWQVFAVKHGKLHCAVIMLLDLQVLSALILRTRIAKSQAMAGAKCM